ncbi:hypothetical protein ACFL6G_09920 [candidate division KSB1 bacterium]
MGDPGHPEVCLVYNLHEKFNSGEIEAIETDCRSGVLGCVACKENLAEKLIGFLEPFRKNREYYENRKDDIVDIIKDGEKRAGDVARATMEDVHKAMNFG